MRELFQPTELQGKNIAGARGKDQVDPDRVQLIRDAVDQFYPLAAVDMASGWRECRKAMDEYLRRPAWRHKREQKVSFVFLSLHRITSVFDVNHVNVNFKEQ